ncbi:MAG: hypothetical protein ACI8YW_000808 [Flavobacteriaceae bacterium]|jgi:hypothetical protein
MPLFPAIGVLIKPGENTVTSTPFGFSSPYKEAPKFSTYAFVPK